MSMLRKVGVIGYGAIGRAVANGVMGGRVAGAQLVAIVENRTVMDAPVPQMSMGDALEICDVLVECAGQTAVIQYAESILDSGLDLLVTSVGAFADEELADRVFLAHPGRLTFTSGVVGGLDLLSSVAAEGGVTYAHVSTTELPATLIQPWMDPYTREMLATTTEPFEVFHGSAREAATCFPESLDVAATVALTLRSFELVEVQLVADPTADLTRHVIEVHGKAGVYRFDIANRPSSENPLTSVVVAHAVLRSLSVLIGNPLQVV